MDVLCFYFSAVFMTVCDLAALQSQHAPLTVTSSYYISNYAAVLESDWTRGIPKEQHWDALLFCLSPAQ